VYCRFLIAGYCNGMVAIYDITTTSPLLLDYEKDSLQDITVISPFWTFQAHLGPVTGVNFDPAAPRHFITASKDRYLKVWDLDLRQEVESRKIGLVMDSCWIRGWIHVAITMDAAISNLSCQHNFVRFYQLGSIQARPTCAEFTDISSISFHDGITLQATERGSVTSTYFDNFWRETDYERNKKKHNVVNISTLTLDESSFEPLANNPDKPIDGEVSKEQPRVILTFKRERVKTTLPDPKPQFFEDYARFLPYIRINKIAWSPLGGFFATGYRCGLLTVSPANFDSLYAGR